MLISCQRRVTDGNTCSVFWLCDERRTQRHLTGGTAGTTTVGQVDLGLRARIRAPDPERHHRQRKSTESHRDTRPGLGIPRDRGHLRLRDQQSQPWSWGRDCRCPSNGQARLVPLLGPDR